MVNKLSARAVTTLKEPGRYSDGGGLYLSLSPDGSRRRWVSLFRWRAPGEKGLGKLREMGLGSANAISLAQARELAARARTVVKEGRNPLDERREKPKVPTFGETADEVVASLEVAWCNPKHRDQWRMTLTRYCAPTRELS